MRIDSFYQNVILLFSILILFGACKPSEKNDSAKAEGTEVVTEPSNDMRATALALIQHRSKDNKTYAIMSGGYWHYQYVFDKTMSKPGDYDGHYLKFKDDFTYEYGFDDRKDGTGKYHFRLDDYMLIMVDDDPSVEPKEWEVKYGGDSMVLVGSHGFGNNGVQIKMLHSIEKDLPQ
jgi:hypothetical protein